MGDVHFEFDEDFNNVLKRANRREMMNYRNAIIDELKTRIDRSSLDAQKKRELKSARTLSKLLLLSDIFLAIIILGLIIVDVVKIYSGEFGPKMMVVIIALDAFLICCVAFSLHDVFRKIFPKKPPKKAIVSTGSITSHDPLKGKLRKEETEVLEKKQEILDQKLGL